MVPVQGPGFQTMVALIQRYPQPQLMLGQGSVGHQKHPYQVSRLLAPAAERERLLEEPLELQVLVAEAVQPELKQE